jgi:hypothetical protein
MRKGIQLPLSELHFFRLPLERGTTTLTLDCLNRHSEFRRPLRPYLNIGLKKIAYQNEILIVGVKLDKEGEETVYLRVMSTEVLVSCSVDTHETYLSRYAYFALVELMRVHDYFDFDKFYWPGFFNADTGKSRYLDIINDRCGMDVTLKSKYSLFFKPGHNLIHPLKNDIERARENLIRPKERVDATDGLTIGYCLADTLLKSWHSNHFPFLIPYSALLANNKEVVKSYINFIKNTQDLPVLHYTAVQQQLNELCCKMSELASIGAPAYNSTEKEKQRIREENILRKDKLFLLWQQALPLLVCQPFTHHYHTYGMKNVIGKPIKKELVACSFALEVPKLCFLWIDQGDYYELKLRFRIKKKVLIPDKSNVMFFIHVKDKPTIYYLLETLTDLLVVSFFERYGFTISVLKVHYKQYFQVFTEQLARIYEFASSSDKM